MRKHFYDDFFKKPNNINYLVTLLGNFNFTISYSKENNLKIRGKHRNSRLVVLLINEEGKLMETTKTTTIIIITIIIKTIEEK